MVSAEPGARPGAEIVLQAPYALEDTRQTCAQTCGVGHSTTDASRGAIDIHVKVPAATLSDRRSGLVGDSYTVKKPISSILYTVSMVMAANGSTMASTDYVELGIDFSVKSAACDPLVADFGPSRMLVGVESNVGGKWTVFPQVFEFQWAIDAGIPRFACFFEAGTFAVTAGPYVEAASDYASVLGTQVPLGLGSETSLQATIESITVKIS